MQNKENRAAHSPAALRLLVDEAIGAALHTRQRIARMISFLRFHYYFPRTHPPAACECCCCCWVPYVLAMTDAHEFVKETSLKPEFCPVCATYIWSIAGKKAARCTKCHLLMHTKCQAAAECTLRRLRRLQRRGRSATRAAAGRRRRAFAPLASPSRALHAHRAAPPRRFALAFDVFVVRDQMARVIRAEGGGAWQRRGATRGGCRGGAATRRRGRRPCDCAFWRVRCE